MNKNNLPNNLYELRRRHGLSQEEFAEKLYVSRQAVSKWERGEAYPDTENLIAISEMFGVTIDELLKSENICKDEPLNNADDSESKRDEQDGFRVNIGNKVKLNLNGGIVVNDEDGTVKVDLGNGGIIVNNDDCEIKLGKCGIEINDDDDNVKIKLDKHGIEINDNDDTDDDDDDDFIVASDCGRKRSFASVLYSVPYPIIVSVAFLVLGLCCNAWYWAWTLFLTIPVYYPLISSIRKRRFTVFPFTALAAFIYFLLGMLYGIWHPLWLIFLAIPVYYPIAAAIDTYNRNRNKRKHRR